MSFPVSCSSVDSRLPIAPPPLTLLPFDFPWRGRRMREALTQSASSPATMWLEAGGGDDLVVKTDPAPDVTPFPPLTLSHGPRSSEMWHESILEMGGCGEGSPWRSDVLFLWWWWCCRAFDDPRDFSPLRPTWPDFSSAAPAQRFSAVEGLLEVDMTDAEWSFWAGAEVWPRPRGLLPPRLRPSCGVFQVDCMEFSIMRFKRLSSPCRSCARSAGVRRRRTARRTSGETTQFTNLPTGKILNKQTVKWQPHMFSCSWCYTSCARTVNRTELKKPLGWIRSTAYPLSYSFQINNLLMN